MRVCGVGFGFHEWGGLVFGLEIVQAVTLIVAVFRCRLLVLRLDHLEQTWFSWSPLEVCQDGGLSSQRRPSLVRWSCLRGTDTGRSCNDSALLTSRFVLFISQLSALLRNFLLRQSRVSPRLERVNGPSMILIPRNSRESSSLPCPRKLETRRDGDILSGQSTAHGGLLARDAAPVQSGRVFDDKAFAVVTGCGCVLGRRLEWAGDLAVGSGCFCDA